MNKLYRKYPESIIESLEQFDHVMAMTKESLHGKAEIAAELAYRDIINKGLKSEIEQLKKELDELKGYMAMTEVNFDGYVEDSQAEREQLKKENEEIKLKLLHSTPDKCLACGVYILECSCHLLAD